MKNYTFNYPPLLGAFLDDRGIEWYAEKEDRISIELVDDTQFVDLIRAYCEWYQAID